ncbi:alpha/beta hydrolase [Microlunatus antarcticus]|uniref:Acetyl esterase/lipase n=1 Tax=Microlunatus antarcticus TaxID=53388 RepID=A0A7W5P7A4_9ACTN|nr:alpha/beta hydrolase [Microlunatus antarcticus]MBB3326646.1 acetyl esterase/lipase [Microlunatus antarcticus]
MTLAMDPETAAALAALFAGQPEAPLPAVGDVAARRARSEENYPRLFAGVPQAVGVTRTDRTLTVADGTEILLRWYVPQDRSDGAAVLYLHGGGMIMGSVELNDAGIASFAELSGVPMLAVDYRLAPEFPHPVPVEDCYAALVWLAAHADELGVDPARVAVMGDSAGGGLAAGVALLARDRSGPALARQILVYPMLDDRNLEPDPRFSGLITWSYVDNVTGWQALLSGNASGDDVSPYAAPARATDLRGLPPTYLDVGDLDIFLDEDLAYAARLAAAGVPVELHVHPGAPHGFELYAPGSALAQRVRADRVRALRSL